MRLLLTAAPRLQQGFDADFEKARVLLAGHGCGFLLSAGASHPSDHGGGGGSGASSPPPRQSLPPFQWRS